VLVTFPREAIIVYDMYKLTFCDFFSQLEEVRLGSLLLRTTTTWITVKICR
jgi:hypothetical protein